MRKGNEKARGFDTLYFVYRGGRLRPERRQEGKGPDSTADQEELLPLRVAVQEYYVSSPVGYIVEKGLDREYGLELELVMYPSGAEQILDADQDVYDVATIGASFLYPLMEDQAVLIGEHIKSTGADAIYVKPDSPISWRAGVQPDLPRRCTAIRRLCGEAQSS